MQRPWQRSDLSINAKEPAPSRCERGRVLCVLTLLQICCKLKKYLKIHISTEMDLVRITIQKDTETQQNRLKKLRKLPFKQWVRGSNPRRVTKNSTTQRGGGVFAVGDSNDQMQQSGGLLLAAGRTAATQYLPSIPGRQSKRTPAGHQKLHHPTGWWSFCFLQQVSSPRRYISVKAGWV